MEKKNENLKYILTRFDNYINASNVKGTFIVALNTFIVGGVLVNRNSISEILICNEPFLKLFNFVLFAICFSALCILFFTIKALFPYIDSGDSVEEEYTSNIYFGSVSKFKDKNEYSESINKIDDSTFEKDLTYQIYTISKGLNKKYAMLNKAMYFIYFELLLFLLIFILLIFK